MNHAHALIRNAALLLFAAMLLLPLGACSKGPDADRPIPPNPHGTGTGDVKAKVGSTVKIHYRLRVDGKLVDDTYFGDPLEFVVGKGEMIAGVESAMVGLRAGQRRAIVVPPVGGYGEYDPEKVSEAPRAQIERGLEPGVKLEPGLLIFLKGSDGKVHPVTVKSVGEDTVTLDLNHPQAGKDLHFDIEVVEVRE